MNVNIYKYLGYIQIFAGVGAITGGLPLVLNPEGTSEAINVEMLQGTPFRDFLVPGLYLVVFVGIAQLIAAYLSLNFRKATGIFSVVTGALFLLWVLLQLYYAGFVNYMQPAFFALATLEIIFGAKIMRQKPQES
ncbi:MAG: hypothetical protein JXR50_03585 [Prolixibacteraceae bacterium]|nr:hypothetical protein [Prolixibacteraceae bacterium]MBN2648804.1 hypothetical protein [Prolixibacteraceae bacterium]